MAAVKQTHCIEGNRLPLDEYRVPDMRRLPRRSAANRPARTASAHAQPYYSGRGYRTGACPGVLLRLNRSATGKSHRRYTVNKAASFTPAGKALRPDNKRP